MSLQIVSDPNDIISDNDGIIIGNTFINWEALYPSITKQYGIKNDVLNVSKDNVPNNNNIPIQHIKKYAPIVHNIDIYTDGSHQRAKNYLGFGIYCKYNDVEYSLSQQCTPELMKTYEITEDCLSNPSSEYAAFAEALKIFAKVKLHKDSTLTFYADYIGVKNWTEGSWKAKKPYIIKIRNRCLELMKQIGCNIKIVHINGHSGNVNNDKADKLAGDVTNFSNFDDLVKVLTN